jgi:hypothetical protein
MEKSVYITRITILTLAAALVGISVSVSHYLYALLMIPILLIPKYAPIIASHEWQMVAQFTTTTFIFGLIDGYSLLDMFSYINDGC